MSLNGRSWRRRCSATNFSNKLRDRLGWRSARRHAPIGRRLAVQGVRDAGDSVTLRGAVCDNGHKSFITEV